MCSSNGRGLILRVAAYGCAATLSAVALAGPRGGGERPGTPVTFVSAFTQGEIADRQCTEWNAFRAKLSGSYSSITLSGSKDPVGRTCTGAAANVLCQALRRGDAVTDLPCDGTTWNVDYCAGESWELSADGTACSCVGDYDVRPCIDTNGDWGGLAGPVCESGKNGDQTITVVCR